MGQWHTFPLRILKGSWGISIDLRARAVLSENPDPGLLDAGHHLLLDLRSLRLPPADIEQLLSGAKLMAAEIEAKAPAPYVIIEVDQVVYTPTDYQPEGMGAVIVGWLCEEFGLESPIKDVHFDRTANRYVFAT
jgi:hypothetical protein